MNNKVSVLMSVYNTNARYLRKSIESILQQTYSHFEFIIVLDCPNDKSEIIVEEYAEKDSRIKIINNEHNLGLTKSLNVALEHATGDFIARMDADDFSVPTRLEVEVDYLESHADVGVVGGHVYTGIKGQRSMTACSKNHEITKAFMLFHNAGVPHPTAMFRRVINGEKVYYNEDILKGQDYELWSRLVMKTKIVTLNQILLIYRIHPDQISSIPTGQYKYSKIVIENQLRNYLAVDETALIDLVSNIFFGDNEISDSDIKQAFENLVLKNRKIKCYKENDFQSALQNVYAEYTYNKLLANGNNRFKTLKKMMKKIGFLKTLSFILSYFYPKVKHDRLSDKFKTNNVAYIECALGE